MKTKLDQSKLEAYRLILTANARLLKRIDSDMLAAGKLPLDWYDVLLTLRYAPDRRLRMHELAESILLSRSGLTRHLDKLEEEGLIERVRCKSDRRGVWAAMTDKGAAALRDSWPTYAESIEKYVGKVMSAKEAELLTELLQRIVTNLAE